MVIRNANLARLPGSYLFVEVGRRVEALRAKQPNAQLIRLSIGDTTQPIPTSIATEMAQRAEKMSVLEGYVGYGPERGMELLRQRISSVIYQGRMTPDEIYISDGAKCDLGRLQLLFDPSCAAAVQDPAYPVYVDTSLVAGRRVIYWPCTPENSFFPDLDTVEPAPLIFFCSPANPTGAVASRAQLQRLVDFARAHRSIIIYDAAYAPFVRDPATPRSIFEIDGARQVALEVNSFSKFAGFTGVRLGWTAIPRELCFSDGSPVAADWSRIISTYFNGASCVAQWGGIACLTPEGMAAVDQLAEGYLNNAALLRAPLTAAGLSIYGGQQAPYLWVHTPGRDSWQLFSQLLEQRHLVVIPGGGFGQSGSNFLRLSAFGSRPSIEEAALRLSNYSL
jgi:LL-diaminopimelate aminotransferase